jgi:hypothetical protein
MSIEDVQALDIDRLVAGLVAMGLHFVFLPFSSDGSIRQPDTVAIAVTSCDNC